MQFKLPLKLKHAGFENAAQQYEFWARERPDAAVAVSTAKLQSDIVSELRRVEQNTQQTVSNSQASIMNQMDHC